MITNGVMISSTNFSLTNFQTLIRFEYELGNINYIKRKQKIIFNEIALNEFLCHSVWIDCFEIGLVGKIIE